MFQPVEDSRAAAEAEASASAPDDAEATIGERRLPAVATVSDLMVATMVNWGFEFYNLE